jgi:hypothetical protein
MPGFDKTGPEGEGRLSGRGLGRCGRVNRDTAVSTEPSTDRRLGSDQPFGRGGRCGSSASGGRGRGRAKRRGFM